MINKTSPEIGGMGHSIKRKEDARFIQGKGNYVDDVHLPGMVYGHMVRSPYAHARLKCINTEKAKKLPGVLAIITGEDLAKANLAWMPTLSSTSRWCWPPAKFSFNHRKSRSLSPKTDTLPPMPPNWWKSNTKNCRSWSILTRPRTRMRRFCAKTVKRSPIIFFIGKWATGPAHRECFSKCSGKGHRPCVFPALPSRAARNLRLRRRFQPRHREAYDLPHFASAARAPNLVFHRRRNSGAEYSCRSLPILAADLATRSHLSRLCLRGRCVVHARPSREVDRDALRESAIHWLCPGLSHDRGNRRRPQRQGESSARENSRRSRRVQRRRAAHQISRGTVQHLHRLLRFPQAFCEVDGVYTNKAPGGIAYRCSFRVTEAAYLIERAMDVLAAQLKMDPAEFRRKNFIPAGQVPLQVSLGLDLRQRQLRRGDEPGAGNGRHTRNCAKNRPRNARRVS